MSLHCDPSELVERAMQARKEGRLDDARAAITDAVAVVGQMGDAAGLAEPLVLLAEIERHRGDKGASVEAYDDAAEAFRTVGDRRGVAHALRHKVDINREAGRLADAEADLPEALALHRGGAGTELDLANMLRVAALLKEDQGDLSAALHFWQEARDGYQACDELLKRLTGSNAGVEEAERRIARLG